MTKNQRLWDYVRFLFKYIANTQNTCPHAHAYTRTHRIRRDTHSPKNAYKSGLIYRKTTWNPPKAFDCAPSFDGLDVTRACFDPFPWWLKIDEPSIKVNEIKQTWWSYKCGASRDLVPFVQFKEREKHPWRSVTFSKVAG